MPFTPAHAAIVLPLPRWCPRLFLLPALVVGSMSPDFEYFVHLRPLRTIGHDLAGIPLLCVPAGLLVLVLFEHLLKGPLIDLFPAATRRRLSSSRAPAPLLPFTRLAVVVASLAVGAFSHIAWDSFTHENGWGVRHVPLLSAALGDDPASSLRVYTLLQHASTLVGLAVLAAWWLRWLGRQPEADGPEVSPLPERARIAVLSALLVVPGLVGLALALRASGGLYRMAGHFVVAAISSGFLVLVAYSVVSVARLTFVVQPEP